MPLRLAFRSRFDFSMPERVLCDRSHYVARTNSQDCAIGDSVATVLMS
jgi:hypothetical protein